MSEHLITCNNHNAYFGENGCICRVVNKHEYDKLTAQVTALAEALKRNEKEWDDFNKIEPGHHCDAKVRLLAVHNRSKAALSQFEKEPKK